MIAVPTEVLPALDAAAALQLIEASSDIALVLDECALVLNASLQDAGLARELIPRWLGQDWASLVTEESRDKIQALMGDALRGAPMRWRQVNHALPAGEEDLPVLYAVLRLPQAAEAPVRLVAFGRDLRPTVQLQHRLVDAQQAMERDYWRFREAETRYRNLFQTSPEAVLVVDGQTQKVLEANPAAVAMASRSGGRLVGAALASLFEAGGADALHAHLAAVRATGQREAVRLLLSQGAQPVDVLVSVLRQDQKPFLLVRLLPLRADAAALAGSGAAKVPGGEASVAARLMEDYARNSPDGLVFTDLQGRILVSNRAFAAQAQLSGEDAARGELLDRWVGHTGVELQVLINNLRQRGTVGLFTTSLRGEFGARLEVELSASLVGRSEQPVVVFAVRDVGRRIQAASEERSPARVAPSPGELTELVGRVPMKDIVSETTDVIEQLCIETALQMTQDNRALAAQLLGLSRQSLYVKLRRYGIGETTDDNLT